MEKKKNDINESLLRELTAIKQLLIIALLRDGVQQTHIAKALGISDSTMSRAFPKGLLKTLKSTVDNGR